MFDPALAGLLMTLGLNLLLPATMLLAAGWVLEVFASARGSAETAACQRVTVAAVWVMPVVVLAAHAWGEDVIYLSMPEPTGSDTAGLGSWGWAYLMAAAFWLAGAAVLWARLIGGLWWTHRLLHESSPAEPALQKRVADLADRHGFVLPEVRTSVRIDVPCVTGFHRPLLLLPRSFHLIDHLDGVLIHELSHLKRRDPAWTLFARALTATLWVHPLVWRLDARTVQTAEDACDDEAIRRTGDALTYARTLLRLAEHGWSPPPHGAVMSVALSPARGQLHRRVRRALESMSAPPRIRRPSASLLAVTLLGLVLLGSTAVAIHHTNAAASVGYAWIWCAPG